MLGSTGAVVEEDVDEVVVVLGGRTRACRDALGQEVSPQPGEPDLDGHDGAVGELPGELLPCEITRDVAGAAQVGSRELAAAARADDLARALVGEVAEELELDHRSLDGPAPSPALLAGVGFEVDPLKRLLDRAQVGVALDVRDQQDVDVGRPETLGDERIVASQDVWDQATEDDQEDAVVTQLVDEPQERELSPRPRVS